jgi:hypothetical protein
LTWPKPSAAGVGVSDRGVDRQLQAAQFQRGVDDAVALLDVAMAAFGSAITSLRALGEGAQEGLDRLRVLLQEVLPTMIALPYSFTPYCG